MDSDKSKETAKIEGLMSDKTYVAIYLVNGIKLLGTIKAQDDLCLILEQTGVEQVVYKHAVSTVMPQKR